MTFLLERSMNDYIQTDGHALIEAKRRVRTEAPGHHCFAHPPVHWPRAAAPPPLRCHFLLPGAMGCCLGPTPTHCEGRLWTKPFSKPLRAGFSFKKLHQAPFTLYEPMWINGESILSALHNHPFLHVLPSNGKPNLFKTQVASGSCFLLSNLNKLHQNTFQLQNVNITFTKNV